MENRNRFYQDFDTEALPGKRPSGDHDHRSPFQIDRDRVLFSYAFRRLQSKTQVFQSGEYDFYRTRLTHSLEVARIGRSICDALRAHSTHLEPDFFIDPDLVEAVGFAHDIGHPPFGHIGERKLNELMAGAGGFEGNAQTARILTELIYERPAGPVGMSPTRAFLDGVLKYKQLHREAKAANPGGAPPENHFLYDGQGSYRDFVFGGEDPPAGADHNRLRSIECQIMDWADDTAYSLHDITDGIKAGFITASRVEQWGADAGLDDVGAAHLEALLETIRKGNPEARFSNKVGAFIRAAELAETGGFLSARSHRYAFALRVDPAVAAECAIYKRVANDLIFQSTQIQQIEFKGGHILSRLFDALTEHYVEGAGRPLKILPPDVAGWIGAEPDDAGRLRRICDHLAGLTDGLATRTYKRLFDPDYGSIVDLS